MFQLVAEILSILAPAAILASIGVIWTKSGRAFPVPFVSAIVTSIGLPALLFHTLATSTVDISALGNMVVATFVVVCVFTLVSWMYLKQAKKDWRLCIAHVMGNTGNLGLPVCYFAYGDEGIAYAMAFFAVQCLLLFSVGEAVLSGNRSIKPAITSPILHAVWLGMLVRYMEWPMPKFLMDTTSLLGQMVIPFMLITLGVSLAGMSVRGLPSTVFWSLLRTCVAIVIGFAVASMLGLEGVARGVLIIETAVPIAVFNFLIAVKHNRDSTELSGLILVTHLAAIFYLPVLLGVLLA